MKLPMKKLSLVVVLLGAEVLRAQSTVPPREATAAEVNAGTSSTTFISPRRLNGSSSVVTLAPGVKSVDGGVVDLAATETSKAVVFNAVFSAAPGVMAQLFLPDGAGSGIKCWPDESTRTATGVTFRFSAAVPGSGYKLAWMAAGATATAGASPVAGSRLADSGAVALSAGATSAVVSFNFGFQGTPAPAAVIAMPNSGGDAIQAVPDESTLSNGGVTFRFNAAIPATGYYLRWVAVGS